MINARVKFVKTVYVKQRQEFVTVHKDSKVMSALNQYLLQICVRIKNVMVMENAIIDQVAAYVKKPIQVIIAID